MPDNLATVYQKHSNIAVVAGDSWTADAARADAVVTATPGVVVGIVTADCAPVLLCDPEARVVGAAHAGAARLRGCQAGRGHEGTRRGYDASSRPSVRRSAKAHTRSARIQTRFLETESDSDIFFANDRLGRPHFDLRPMSPTGSRGLVGNITISAYAPTTTKALLQLSALAAPRRAGLWAPNFRPRALVSLVYHGLIGRCSNAVRVWTGSGLPK